MRSRWEKTSHRVVCPRSDHRRFNMQQLIPVVLLVSLWTVCTGSGEWCYQSQFSCKHECNTPEKWEHASENCAGKKQSPINIVTRKTIKDERLTPFQFNNYQQMFKASIKNNGHSVQVDVPIPSTVNGGGLSGTYKAVQFHLHWGSKEAPGSEHTIDGEQYPMELHIVHMKRQYTDLKTAMSDKEGVAVLGFFYEMSNSANKNYEDIISSLKKVTYTSNSTTPLSTSLASLIPPQQNLSSYYRYSGSLTTPSCNEAVVWTLFENPILLSSQQLGAFYELKFHGGEPMVGNFRPVQPLNGRPVFRSGGAVLLASIALLVATFAMALGLSQPN